MWLQRRGSHTDRNAQARLLMSPRMADHLLAGREQTLARMANVVAPEAR